MERVDHIIRVTELLEDGSEGNQYVCKSFDSEYLDDSDTLYLIMYGCLPIESTMTDEEVYNHYITLKAKDKITVEVFDFEVYSIVPEMFEKEDK